MLQQRQCFLVKHVNKKPLLDTIHTFYTVMECVYIHTSYYGTYFIFEIIFEIRVYIYFT